MSNQSIPLTVKGVIAYKVGDDLASIANAARRFLDQDATVMQSTIHEPSPVTFAPSLVA